MRRSFARLAWAALGVACFVGAAVALRRVLGGTDLADLRLRPLPLAASGLLFVVTYVLAAFLWHDLLALAGAARDRRREAAAWLLSQLGKYLPGNVPVLAIRVGRGGTPTAAVGAAMVYEAALYVGVALVFGIPALGTARGMDRAVAIGALLVVAGLAAHRPLHRLLDRIVRRTGRPSLGPPPPLAALVRAAALIAIYWALVGTTFWLFIAALLPPVPWSRATAAIALGWSAGFLAIVVPGGIGVREAALVVLLAPVTGAGPAAVVAATHRAWITLLDLAVSLAGSALLGRRWASSDGDVVAREDATHPDQAVERAE